MRLNSKRFLAVFLTLLFAAGVFSTTAFAQSDPGPTAITQQTAEPPSSNHNENPSTGGETPNSGGDNTNTSKDNSTGGETSKPEEPSKPEEVSKPDETSRAASSKASSKNTSSKKPSTDEKAEFTHKVDTHNQKVEEAASRAAQTISSPDVLSSQDWGELLSSTGSTDSSSVAAAAGTTSSNAGKSSGVGGVSWLLILGIVLIVLSLCGIGLFVYLQFFSGPKGTKKNGIPAPVHKSSGEEPTEFVDISSFSDSPSHSSGAVSDAQELSDISSSSEKAPAVKKAVQKSTVSDQDETAPIPQEMLQRNKPQAAETEKETPPKSQAQPVNGSDFNWEKFFNEEK